MSDVNAMSMRSPPPFSPVGVCICEYPYRLELSSFKPAGGAEPIHYSNAREARNFLKSQLHPPFVLQQLRQLLAGQNGGALYSDDALWDEVAWRLAWGKLYLARRDDAQSGGASAASSAAAPAASRTADAPPRRPAVSAPPPLPPPRKRLSEEESAPPLERTASLAQDVQAGALERAARRGTPFCAVCEARAAAAAAAAAAPVPA